MSVTRDRLVRFGSLTLPLVAVLIGSSSSRAFGLPKIGEWPQLTADRIVIAALCLLMTCEVIAQRMRFWNVRLTEVGLIGVACFASISGIVYGGFFANYSGGNPDIVLKCFIIPAIVFAATLRTELSSRRFGVFLALLTGFGIYLSLTAIAERLGYTWALFPAEIGDPRIEQHLGRARGPFLQAEFNGTVMAMLLPLALLLTSFRQHLCRFVGFVAACLLCVGSYLTYTRAVLLSMLLVVLCGSWSGGLVRKSYRFLLATVSAGAIILLTIGSPLIPRLDDVEPVAARIRLLAVTANMISAHPLFGIGFANFDHLQTDYYDAGTGVELSSADFWEGGTHNSLLTPVAELGLFAGGLYLFLVGRVMFTGIRYLRRAEMESRDASLVLCGVLIGIVFVVNASLVELRYTLTPNALFWFGAALIEGVAGRTNVGGTTA